MSHLKSCPLWHACVAAAWGRSKTDVASQGTPKQHVMGPVAYLAQSVRRALLFDMDQCQYFRQCLCAWATCWRCIGCLLLNMPKCCSRGGRRHRGHRARCGGSGRVSLRQACGVVVASSGRWVAPGRCALIDEGRAGVGVGTYTSISTYM